MKDVTAHNSIKTTENSACFAIGGRKYVNVKENAPTANIDNACLFVLFMASFCDVVY